MPGMNDDAPVPPSGTLPTCVINCAAYDRNGQRRDITLDQISDVLAVDDGSFVWVGMYEPEPALLDKLQEEFGLHDLAIEDAQHAHQRPKIEAYGESLFVVMHTAQVVAGHIRFGETYAFLGPRYLVTVRHGASLSYAPVRARVEREPELLALGPTYGLYAVLDFVVDQYLPIVTEFRDELNKLEQDIFAETYRRDVIVKLYDLKRELTQLRLAVSPLQDILAQLTRMHGGKPWMTEFDNKYVRAAGKDEAMILVPPMRLTLERALSYIQDDELVEVTPQNIRLRKRELLPHLRKRAKQAMDA